MSRAREMIGEGFAGGLPSRSVPTAGHASVMNTQRRAAHAACGSAGVDSDFISPITASPREEKTLIERVRARKEWLTPLIEECKR